MKEQEMQEMIAANDEKELQERLATEKKTLANLVTELPALALAYAKIHKARRPVQRRGRLHAV